MIVTCVQNAALRVKDLSIKGYSKKLLQETHMTEREELMYKQLQRVANLLEVLLQDMFEEEAAANMMETELKSILKILKEKA